jgi:hypothetical protein
MCEFTGTSGNFDKTNAFASKEINFQNYHEMSYMTSWSRVLLEKLVVSRVVEKFVAFYGT